ncbi:MAG: glycosyltransferase family 4 protein [Candidatus Hodarchaeales archaeon]
MANSILHIGDSPAGVPQKLSRAQRRIGLKSDILNFLQYKFEYEVDFHWPRRESSSLKHLRYIEALVNATTLLKISKDYDVFHFHYRSALPGYLDLPIWKGQKKKIIIHHHGSDLRYRGEPRFCSKFADRILVSTPDLLEWSPEAVWIPNPISLENFHFTGVDHKDGSENVTIVHAPSHRSLKGTEHLIRAVKELKEERYKADLLLVENLPYRKAIESYKQADIVVDQLLIGWYGVFALECMAIGKPVCVYIRNDLESYLPSQPVFNTCPKNLLENLRILIEDCKLRRELGERGRKHVQELHDAHKITRKVTKLYNT